MKKIICSLICFSSAMSFAQSSILNATSPQNFIEDREVLKEKIEPLKYGFIEDKDVFKSMVVWEVIDMNDKINQPFYHNNDGLVSQNKSLYQVLLDGVNSGKIQEVYSDDTFSAKLTPDQIMSSTSAVVVSDYFSQTLNENRLDDAEAQKLMSYFTSVINSGDPAVSLIAANYGARLEDVLEYNGSAVAGEKEVTTTTGKVKNKKTVTKKVAVSAPTIEEGTILLKLDGTWYKIRKNDIFANVDKIVTSSEKVKALKLMGMWYIDKRNTQLKYRLIGIAAMGEDPNSAKLKAAQRQALVDAGQSVDEAALGATDLIDLFWIYYPDARQVLTSNYVFNPKNTSSDISYDDILNARRFSSVIYKTDNGLGKAGSGIIDQYIPEDAEGQLEESDRIKARILQMENDLWNY